MQSNQNNWIENLAWPEIEQRIQNGAFAILPVGAASKEHGRHMPLNTDYRQAKWLASQVALQFDALIWPIVNYGYYPAFVDYPGSISIDENTFCATIESILNGICFSGIGYVVILNTGISTIRPLTRAVEKADRGRCTYLHNVYSGCDFKRTEKSLSEQSFGGHADELETSIMLALDETAVDLSMAKPQAVEIGKGLFNRTDPEQLNFSPDGVNGDPSCATVAKGERLLQALLSDCLTAINEALSGR